MLKMNSKRVARKRTRAYQSPLRRDLMEETRRRICEGAVELAASGAMTELSLPLIAKKAGVSIPTVYRHFPTHESLLDAVMSKIGERLNLVVPKNAEELPAYVHDLYRAFDLNEGLARASRSSALGLQLRSRGQAVRNRQTLAAIAAYLPDLSPTEARQAASVLRQIVSVAGWQGLRDSYDLDGETAARTAAWAVRTLLDNLHTLKRS